MSCQQIREVMSLPPDPPHVNNNNYICLKYCPKGLDHLTLPLFEIIKVIIPLILPGNFFDEFQLMVMIIRPMMVPES